eukprot:1485884-Amphidinium_carterae.1
MKAGIMPPTCGSASVTCCYKGFMRLPKSFWQKHSNIEKRLQQQTLPNMGDGDILLSHVLHGKSWGQN